MCCCPALAQRFALLVSVRGPARVVLASGVVLTGWCRRAGRGGVDVPLAPWRARSPVGADMTRENPGEGWCRWPTAGGGGRAGSAAAGGRRCPPWPRPQLALPRLASCPRRHAGGHSRPLVSRSAGTTAGRPPRARVRAATLAPRRHQPPASATPCRVSLIMSAATGDRARQGASGTSTPPLLQGDLVPARAGGGGTRPGGHDLARPPSAAGPGLTRPARCTHHDAKAESPAPARRCPASAAGSAPPVRRMRMLRLTT